MVEGGDAEDWFVQLKDWSKMTHVTGSQMKIYDEQIELSNKHYKKKKKIDLLILKEPKWIYLFLRIHHLTSCNSYQLMKNSFKMI